MSLRESFKVTSSGHIILNDDESETWTQDTSAVSDRFRKRVREFARLQSIVLKKKIVIRDEYGQYLGAFKDGKDLPPERWRS